MDQRRSAMVNWGWIGGAWRVFSGSILTWVLMQLTVLLFFLLTISPVIFLVGGAGVLLSREEWSGLAGLSIFALAFIPVLLVLFVLGGLFLLAGLSRAAIRRAQGEQIGLADLFSAGDAVPSLLGFYLLLAVTLAVVGTVFNFGADEAGSLFAPLSLLERVTNLAVLGFTFFAVPLIVDRRAGVMEAIRQSIALTLPHWPIYLLLVFVIEILSVLGLFLFFVGIIITAHFQWTIPAVAYCEVFGLTRYPSGNGILPPPPSDWSSVPAPKPDEAAPALPTPNESPTLPLACPSCGTTLVRISRFCSQCGTRIGGWDTAPPSN
jgi:hypothetical protein